MYTEKFCYLKLRETVIEVKKLYYPQLFWFVTFLLASFAFFSKVSESARNSAYFGYGGTQVQTLLKKIFKVLLALF
jgi:hypothetical protein